MNERRKRGCHSAHPQYYALGCPWILPWGPLGIPKLRLLVVLEYHLGVPRESPILGSFHSLFHSPSNLSPKHENFNHTKLNRKLISSVSKRKQITTLRYYNELILNSYWCNIYCIPTSLWFIPSDTTHRFIKISKQYIENRICQKQNNL